MTETKTEELKVEFSLEYILPNDHSPLQPISENLKRKVSCIESLSGLEEDGVKRVKKTKFADERLDLDCEWTGCIFNTDKFNELILHVREHISDADIKHNSVSQQDVFVCLWADCYFESPVSEEMVRHINYHSFHTKLKSRGLNMIQREGIKGCTLEIGQRNIFPDLSENFKCEWVDCIEKEVEYNHPAVFYSHVDEHLAPNQLACKWGYCSKRDFASLTRLREHIRSHTQERLIACPACGALFANRVKLLDHLKRQQRGDEGFVCTNCNKSFATERLLKNHMRSHINHYTCPDCGMAWPTPSSLATHIKYRHSKSREYPCEFCEHKAKSPADLKQHARKHQGEVLSCPEGCGYVCKSNASMKSHFLKKHMAEGPSYACHLCDKVYARGQYLTGHLKMKHQVTSTTSRFRYSLDEATGMYRAQLIRFEIQDEDAEDKEIAEAVDDPDPVHGHSSVRSVSSMGSRASSPASQYTLYHSSPKKRVSPSFSPAFYCQTDYKDSSPADSSSAVDEASQASAEGYSVAVFPPSVEQLVTSSPIKGGGSDRLNDIVTFSFSNRFSGMAGNVEIDITGEQFGENGNSRDPLDTRDLAAPQDSVVDLKRTGAQLSDLSLFMTTISNMFPKQQ